jgi:hypothetical protein
MTKVEAGSADAAGREVVAGVPPATLGAGEEAGAGEETGAGEEAGAGATYKLGFTSDRMALLPRPSVSCARAFGPPSELGRCPTGSGAPVAPT